MTITSEIKREQVLEALKDLPETDALEEALERLYVLYKIQKGIEAADRGETVSHAEAIEQLGKWFI
jgi:predicted transcriptional regulator